LSGVYLLGFFPASKAGYPLSQHQRFFLFPPWFPSFFFFFSHIFYPLQFPGRTGDHLPHSISSSLPFLPRFGVRGEVIYGITTFQFFGDLRAKFPSIPFRFSFSDCSRNDIGLTKNMWRPGFFIFLETSWNL